MKHILKATVSVAAASLILAGCSSSAEAPDASEDGPQTIVYAIPAGQAEQGGLKDMIAAWEKKTGNTVKLEPIAENYESVVSARLAGGAGVDIFNGPYDKFDPKGTMAVIDPQSFKDRVTPATMESLTFDGEVYAYPKPDPMYSFGIFYNKDVFADAGITDVPLSFDEFDSALAKIEKSGVTPLFIAGKDGWTMLQHRNAVFYTLTKDDPDVWKKLNENKTRFDELPAFTSQYEQLQSWVDDGYINDNFLTATNEESMKAVAEGSAAMVFQGSWVVGEIAAIDPNAKIGFLPIPTEDGKPQVAVSAQGGGNHIAKQSKVKKAAADLLEYLIEPTQVTSFMSSLPGIRAFNDADLPADTPDAIRTLNEYVDNGQYTEDGDNRYLVPSPDSDLIALYQEFIAKRIDAKQFSTAFTDSYVNNGRTEGLPGF